MTAVTKSVCEVSECVCVWITIVNQSGRLSLSLCLTYTRVSFSLTVMTRVFVELSSLSASAAVGLVLALVVIVSGTLMVVMFSSPFLAATVSAALDFAFADGVVSVVMGCCSISSVEF